MDIFKAAKELGIDLDLGAKRKHIDPADNASNMRNKNEGTLGTNRQYDQVHGNRGKQLNPNQKQPTDNASEMDNGDVYGGSESSD